MDEKELKKFLLPIIVMALAVLSFLIIKPIVFPVLFGLLLAYGFYSLYQKLKSKIKLENTSAFIVVLGTLVVILLPPLLLMPLFIKELFTAYISLKGTDFSALILHLFPAISSSPALATEVGAAASHFSAAISNGLLSIFQSTLMNLPAIMFGILILLFTFFFGLKEGHEFKEYFSTFFPFGDENKNRFFSKFEQVTNSIVFGHIVIGIVQGLVAGVAYYLFGVPNALILTVLTMIVGVLPIIGPWIVWVPADLFLFINGDTIAGIQLLIYSLFVINWTDVLLRPFVVAAKAEMNSAIVLIGAIGGTYAFGIMGFLLGPLFLAYFILVLELYKNKKTDSIVLKEAPAERLA
jgi:predicted PurR-regulated permease PerM